MYSRKEETSLEMAMSAAIAAVRTRNGNMTSEEVLKEAEVNTKKKYPMLFEQPAESKQDDVPPAYEEEVETTPEQNNTNFAQIDLGTGLPVNTDEINKGFAQEYDPSNPARAYIQGSTPQPVPQQPIPQQPQYPVNPMFTKPLHRVDEPPKPKKEIPPEDRVDVNLGEIDISGLKKPPVVKQVPAPVNNKLQNPAPADTTVKNIFDNTEMIQKYPKVPLKEIEAIANANGHSVAYEEYPHIGLITVIAVGENGKAVLPKCFTIHTGVIIDKRLKLFAACPRYNQDQILEFAPVYELMMIDSKQHGRKVLDAKMLNDIFYAGLGNISKREMFSEEYKALNRKVAMISLPTKKLNKEQRGALQDFVVKMDKDGYLDKALALAPGSRFVFLNMDKELDPNHLGTFTLINEGVPLYYGTMANKVNPVIIDVVDGKISIKSNGATVDPAIIVPGYNHPEGCNCGHC